ncbi:hypothetical protein [uncultured Muribaculum sp.]|jgi:hypothetical protein|nr:hypothetical protein [uncultured Muribaculum sp.]
MKAKTMLITVIAFLSMCSCGQSKEEKAQQMAAKYLKGTLYHFKSYEPLQTKVDSFFVSLSCDNKAIEFTLEMLKLFQSAEEYARNVEHAERSMDIWSPNRFSSTYSRGEYDRAKNERDENQRLLDNTKDRIQAQFENIKTRQSEIEEGAFNGWIVYHKFKSLNGAGTLDLFGEYIFLCDKDFNVESVYSKEDFDALSKIIGAISESEEFPELGEKLQEIIF